jgi:hypothetical protein
MAAVEVAVGVGRLAVVDQEGQTVAHNKVVWLLMEEPFCVA